MNKYIRHSKASIGEVLGRMSTDSKKIEINGQTVKVVSLRLQTFLHKGVVCAYCKLKARFFALEKDSNTKEVPYHLNLYGFRDGEEVLFTHDHMVARCFGGPDTLANTTTACYPCNMAKGQIEQNAKHRKS